MIESYRRRAIEIEAIHITQDYDFRDLWEECSVSRGEKTQSVESMTGSATTYSWQVWDALSARWNQFDVGDWIVKGVHGEYFPVSPEVFLATYRHIDTGDDSLLSEVQAEMDRQVFKWGEQNHQSVLAVENGQSVSEQYIGISEEDAKAIVDRLAETGALTYADIAVEEFAEALDAKNDVDMREELIQLGAVIGSWIQSIDRRNADV